jgi:hypothetical protein
MTGYYWTWLDHEGVIHGTIGDRGRFQALMRQVICLGSFVDLGHVQPSRNGVVTCLLCLGARYVEA